MACPRTHQRDRCRGRGQRGHRRLRAAPRPAPAALTTRTRPIGRRGPTVGRPSWRRDHPTFARTSRPGTIRAEIHVKLPDGSVW
jgi:hypothetical protein